ASAANDPTDPGAASGDGIQPTLIQGNPDCSDISGGPYRELKVDNVNGPFNGTYTSNDGLLTVTISNSTSQYFDWSSNMGVDAVIVKGGDAGDSYVYDPPKEDTADTDLHPPVNPNNGELYGISHVSFCYDLELQVSKTANTSLKRTYDWTIDKSVKPDTWDLFTGDSGTSDYTVTVNKDEGTDSDWKVTGTITVTAPAATNVTNVTDTVSPSITANVNCPGTFPVHLNAGQSLNCTYSADLPDATTRTNTARAVSDGTNNVKNGTGTASVDFANANIIKVNDSITVDDTYAGAGSPWTFSDDGSKTYSRKFACGDTRKVENTATIKELDKSDGASVQINCYDLNVKKDASTSFTKTYKWTIDKSADKSKVTLEVGKDAPVNYSVKVDKTSQNSDFAVNGEITVANPAPIAAELTNVSDIVSPAINAQVDCGQSFPFTLASGDTLTCSYSGSLPDKTARTNTATASLQNYDYDSSGGKTKNGTTDFSGTAAVDFTNATVTYVDESIDVSDSLQGPLGTVAAADAPKTFTYTRNVGPYQDCGNYEVPNTASFKTNDTGATGEDSWKVDVTVLCKVTVMKTVDGVVNPNSSINFTLTGPGLDSGVTLNTNGDQDGILDFGYKLVPGEKYTICENPVPAGFTSFWKLDGVIVTPYNPGDSKVPQEDLGVRCFDFTASAGQSPAFVVDNSHPGGEPRTIGYWKNWSTCTGGNQVTTAKKNGGAAAGFFLLDDLLPQTIGDLLLPKTATGCEKAVKILSKQDLSGKSRSSDAAYELAAQLLAAKLNLAAGAETCSGVQSAIMNGQALLANGPTDTPPGVNFDGTGSYLPSNTNKVALRNTALSLASTLDKYNNGDLC
ncbi:MAG TPA: hypothetical protein VFI90_15805, partial [Rubrobacter sp.]|nr:hypothetical protein [Rubrobacter sp.]